MKSRIDIRKSVIAADPREYWNEINSFLALSEPEELTGKVRALHELYWIFSEVMNGGYDQYFSNKEDRDPEFIYLALMSIDAGSYAQNHLEAWNLMQRIDALYDNDPENAELDDLEDKLQQIGFYLEDPNALDFIESYVRKNESELVNWI